MLTPFFDPRPQQRARTSDGGGGDATDHPYAAVIVGGLRAGLSLTEMRTIPYTTLLAILDERNHLIEAADEDAERPATQADIDSMLRGA